MGYRRKVRELALGYLYQKDSGVDVVTLEPSVYARHFGVPGSQRDFFMALINGVLEDLAKLDADIEKTAEHWKINRMARVDRVLMRIAAWELLRSEETSHKVIIDEAVELAKKFSTEESARFVNGILDQIAKQYRQL